MAYEALYTRGRPKNLAQLIGQEHISAALTRAVQSGRLSHAYLLVGTRGTGKTSTARLLAKAMNCDSVHEVVQAGKTLSAKDIPCNKCASCLSIDSSPDNVEFDAASNRSVEDVTRLLSTAYLSPLQSRVKTFIIDEVHMLSFEAVNSILKLIEEPPPNVAFFLATTELQKVPMTIRSRCQVLNFRLIPTETISPYLIKLAKRLEVELPEDAAKKIARLAEGSMRDALTYLDQCYAMSDKIISVEDVNQTLGLISDADLDEIIKAVENENHAELAKAISNAFKSGLSSISIAESLIIRLRDLEFANLNRVDELAKVDSFISMLRKTILEMQGSGIPDIILETALMNFSIPKEIFAQQNSEKVLKKIVNVQDNPEIIGNTLDDGRKIFYHIYEDKLVDMSLRICLKTSAALKDFDGKNLTLVFTSETMENIFKESYLKKFEDIAYEFAGRKIKVITTFDDTIKDIEVYRLNADQKKFLEKSKDIFQAEIEEK